MLHSHASRFRLIISILAVVLGVASTAVHAQDNETFGRSIAQPQGGSSANSVQKNEGAGDGPTLPDGINAADDLLSPKGLTPTLKILLLMTVLSLAPSLIIMTSCFIRFVIVFGLLRQALGTQQLPPTQVITSLSLFMTFFIMLPVWEQSWDYGIAPYVDGADIPGHKKGEDELKQVVINTMQPVLEFMSHQIQHGGGTDTVWMLVDMKRPAPGTDEARTWTEPQYLSDVDAPTIVTAYMLTELKTAFMIGFQIYLPFLIIDMVVATVLTGMGMMMLPPTLISVPFKILLFVLIDGWTLTVQMLLDSVHRTVT